MCAYHARAHLTVEGMFSPVEIELVLLCCKIAYDIHQILNLVVVFKTKKEEDV